MFCDGELTAAIKRSGFSYLWPLELRGSEAPRMPFFSRSDTEMPASLGCSRSRVCANMLISTTVANIEAETALANHRWQNCEIAISRSQVDRPLL